MTERAGPAPPPSLQLVAFDMDGTLVDVESSWAEVHHHFHDSNEAALQAFLHDEIDDVEFARRDVALWKLHEPRMGLRHLQEILDRVPLMPGAPELIRALRARSVTTAIVSGGIDVLAERLGRILGIDVVLANGFEVDRQGRLLSPRIRVPIKGKEGVLRSLQSRLGIPPERTASVGNSEIDVGLFKASRIGVAFRPEDAVVRAHASYVVEEHDLRRVIPLLEG
jgi:phosphoserine phosphatase